MPMTRKKKDAVIAAAAERVEGSRLIVLTGFKGIDVASDTELRSKVREAGAHYQVLKNTLAKRVLAGDQYTEQLSNLRPGTYRVVAEEDGRRAETLVTLRIGTPAVAELRL